MFEKLKQEVWQANQRLPESGLVILTWGNVSVIDRKAGVIAIKPSGMPYESMTPEDIVICNLEGDVVDGSRRPSSDLLTHLELYKAWPDIGAVVHTHSTFATMQAQTGEDLEPLGTTHADTFHGAVPCSRELTGEEIRRAYERETGHVIVQTFQERDLDPMAVPGILVSRHGPFTWGADAAHAVENAVILEQCARMAIMDRLLRPDLGPVSQALQDKHYYRKHGVHATYGQG